MSARRAGSAAGDTVTAILLVDDGRTRLVETLDAIAVQTRTPDRLLVLDIGAHEAGRTIVDQHAAVRARVETVDVLRLQPGTPLRQAVHSGVDSLGEPGHDGHWLWLLREDTAPLPEALHHLLKATRRSSGVAIVGPKLTAWGDPGRLLEMGHQLTRTGRCAGGPVLGEPDQGQYDDRGDALGVSAGGMLVRHHLFLELGGFDPAFSGGGEGLDLSWRAHLAGHRVMVEPRAVVRAGGVAAVEATGDGPGSADRRLRLRRRQVALARSSLLAQPFMALWVAVISLGTAAVLLLLKRPRRARDELVDLRAALTPWPGLAARWRFRGRRTVQRRHLRGLFVPPPVALRSMVDGVRDTARPAASAERGPQRRPSAARRVASHPGVLVVLLTSVLALVYFRDLIPGEGLSGSGYGLSGGELRPVHTDARGLWHLWSDGWAGEGLGHGEPVPPWVVLLAGLTWLVELLPWVSVSASPAGTAIAWLLALAMPLSAWSAYAGTRAVAAGRGPRALAALAWACLPPLTTAIASGRLGAVVAHILLPLAAAGVLVTARRGASTALTFATVLALTVMGAFAPALLALSTVVCLLVVLLGRGWGRLRALVVAVVPLVVLGPWVLWVVADPRLLLGGPGLTSTAATMAAPWELALLNPGGPGSYPVLLAVPFLLAAGLGLLRRGPASTPMTWLAALAVVALGAALAAQRLQLAAPGPAQQAGQEVMRPWPGLALSVLAAALLLAAAYGLDGVLAYLRASPLRRGRRWALAPALSTLVAGVVAAALWAAWAGTGPQLDHAVPPRPAVVVAQSAAPAATRMLELVPVGDQVGYALRGQEPGVPFADLSVTAEQRAGAPVELVRSVMGSGAGAGVGDDAHRMLSDMAVAFVGMRAEPSHPLARQLDATAGLTRLSDTGEVALWRVGPVSVGGDGSDDGTTQGAAEGADAAGAGLSRARIVAVDGTRLEQVPVEGPHAAVRTRVQAGQEGRRLVLSEAPGWTDRARVTFDGVPLNPVPGSAWPTYELPASAGELQVAVLPRERTWRMVQGGTLAGAVFLALPFGGRSRRAVPARPDTEGRQGR